MAQWINLKKGDKDMSPPRGESVLTVCVHGESATPRVSAVNLGCRWEKCQLRHGCLWTASGTACPTPHLMISCLVFIYQASHWRYSCLHFPSRHKSMAHRCPLLPVFVWVVGSASRASALSTETLSQPPPSDSYLLSRK